MIDSYHSKCRWVVKQSSIWVRLGAPSLTPFWRDVKSLSELKEDLVYQDLANLATFIELAGISSDYPKEPDGRVSLPFAIAILCGAQEHHASDDFSDLIDSVPGVYRYRFINCWDVIESEVGEDILLWSQSRSVGEVCQALRSMAKHIELS